MKPESRFRMNLLLGIILCVTCVTLSALTIKFDASAAVYVSKFGENSATEKLQLVYLFSTSVMFALTAWRQAEWRGITILMAGGTLMLMIREMDGALDRIYHGAWLPAALAVGLMTAGMAWRQREQLERSLDEFLHTPAFGAFLAACLSIFIFSRLFGMKEVWESLFNVQQLEPVQRWVKNAVEEGSELFGYTLLFLSSRGFSRYVKQFEGATFYFREKEEQDDIEVETVHIT